MITSPDIPTMANGANPRLCHRCQRQTMLVGGYLDWLVLNLTAASKTLAHLRGRYLASLKRLAVGETCGVVTRDRERAVEMAKDVANEREWGILIQRRGTDYLKITRIAAQGTSGSAQDAQRLDPQGAGPVSEGNAP